MAGNKVTPLHLYLTELQALEVKDGAFHIDGLIVDSIEDLPPEIRDIARKVLAGQNETNSGKGFCVKIARKT